MKKLFSILFLMLLGLFLSVGTSSAYILEDWQLSLDGTNKVDVNKFISMDGKTYIENDLDANFEGTFEQWGAFQGDSIEGQNIPYNLFDGWQLTGVFQGQGDIVGGDNFTYTGGTLDLYAYDWESDGFSNPPYAGTDNFYGSNLGTNFASFDVTEGGGDIDAGTDVQPAGSVDVQFTSTNIDSGYFFDSNGNDLAGLPLDWVLSFTNLTSSYDDLEGSTFADEIEDQNYANPAEDDLPNSLFTTSSGEYGMEVVPEPTTMLLFGTGLLGLGFFGRRKLKNRS